MSDEVKRQGRERAGGLRPWRVTLYGPPGRRRGRYRIRYRTPDGVWTTRGASNRRDADEVFDEVERDLDRAEDGITAVSNATVADLVTRYLNRRAEQVALERITDQTFGNDGFVANLRILPVLGRVPVRSWTPALSQQVIDTAQRAGYKDLTGVRKVLSALAKEARRAPAMLPLGMDPMQDVSVRRSSQSQTGPYVAPSERPSSPEVDALVRAAEKLALTTKNRLIPLMVELSARTGIRYGELVGLRPMDLTDEGRTIMLTEAITEHAGKQRRGPTKNRRARRVPVPASLVPALWAQALTVTARKVTNGVWPDGGHDGLLFVGPRGGPWRRNTWHRSVWQKVCVEAGLAEIRDGKPPAPRYRYHSLRHHAAVWLHDTVGVPWVDVSRILGHHSVAFTLSVYVSPGSDSEATVRDLLAGY